MPSGRVYVICTCSHKHVPLQVTSYKGTCIGRVYVICTCSHKHTPLQVMMVWGTFIGNLRTSSAPVHTKHSATGNVS